MSALADTAAFAQSFCDQNAIARPRALRLRLVLEELFTNTVRHGYREESDAPVRIALAMIERHVAVEYSDSAQPYDPLARMSTLPAGEVGPLDGPPGDGLGTYLLGKTLYGARYEYQGGCNRLWLVMPT